MASWASDLRGVFEGFLGGFLGCFERVSEGFEMF